MHELSASASATECVVCSICDVTHSIYVTGLLHTRGVRIYIYVYTHTFAHNSYARTQRLCFSHGVSRKQESAALPLSPQHIPQEPFAHGVHTR